jgi:hypothetical protein
VTEFNARQRRHLPIGSGRRRRHESVMAVWEGETPT